jgi:DNA-binding NarL/FixJ family response regulator
MEPVKSIEDVKNQIIKACEIYKLYPNPHPSRILSSLRYKDIIQQSRDDKIYFRPTPSEVDDADIVQFEWLPRLSIRDRQLLWKRYSGMGWKRLAKEANICERTARNYVEKALKRLYNLYH